MRADMMNVIDIVLLDKINKKADLINGKIPVSQLPESITEEVAVLIEADTYENLPAVGQSNVLYVTTDDSTLWRWSKAKAIYTHENFIKVELGIDDTYSSEVLYISTVSDVKEYSIDISGEYPYVRISNALASEPYWENISIYYREAVEPVPEVPVDPEAPTEPEPDTPTEPSGDGFIEEPETEESLDQIENVDESGSEESEDENLEIEPVAEANLEDEEVIPSELTEELEQEPEVQDIAVILEKSIFPKAYLAEGSEVILENTEGEWGVRNIANYGYGIQFKALEGALYNTVPLNGNITKIILQWANDDYLAISSNGGITVEELAEAISTVAASIPTKTSQLENDSGFITGMPEEYEKQIQETIDESISEAFTDFVFTESDPTVPEWAKAENKPSYTAAEVGALPDTTSIPQALADMTDDATHRLVTDDEKLSWNAKSNFSGSYNDLTNIPEEFNPSEHEHPYISISEKGAANGVATLDANGLVPAAQLPSYVDDIIEGYINTEKTKFYEDSEKTKEIIAESGKIYVDLAASITYRWSGTMYAETSTSLALGETSSTAYYGDKGKAAYEHSQMTLNNPHRVTAGDIGLSAVVNTGDSDTPEMDGKAKFTTGGAYTELLKKVDKIEGKGLSTNDFTDTHKTKVEALIPISAISDSVIDSIIAGTYIINNQLDIPFIGLVEGEYQEEEEE